MISSNQHVHGFAASRVSQILIEKPLQVSTPAKHGYTRDLTDPVGSALPSVPCIHDCEVRGSGSIQPL